MIVAFTGSVLSRTVIVMDYYANTAVYAANCINKTMPAMHCNGKCQMMKRLQQEEKDNRDNQERKASNQTDLIFVDARSLLSNCLFFKTTTAWPHTGSLAPFDRSYSFFCPPLAG